MLKTVRFIKALCGEDCVIITIMSMIVLATVSGQSCLW